MLNFDSFRLSWNKRFLVEISDDASMGAEGTAVKAYRLGIELPKGWYMLEIQIASGSTNIMARLEIASATSGASELPLLIEARRLTKRLVYFPQKGTLRITLESHAPHFNVETFRLGRVTRRFAKSRMLKKLRALHPIYKPFIEKKIAQLNSNDSAKLWQDYCQLFESNRQLVNYEDWIGQFDRPDVETLRKSARKIIRLSSNPKFSFIISISDTASRHWDAAIRSVFDQICNNWHLYVIDDSLNRDLRNELASLYKNDCRLTVLVNDEHDDAISQLNHLLSNGNTWISFVSQYDMLPKHASYLAAITINAQPDLNIIYSDEDCIDSDNIRHSPYFKPEWNEDLMLSGDLLSNFSAYSSTTFRAAGGWSIRFGYAARYDFALRCIPHARKIYHIPRILYHVRSEKDHAAARSQETIEAECDAIREYLKRSGVSASVSSTEYGHHIQYTIPPTAPLVSIIIPTRNGYDLLSRCIESILSRTTYSNIEIIIVDNGSNDSLTLDYLREIENYDNVRILRDDNPFNYSSLNNLAARVANGEFLALLNNDIEVISSNWLEEMVGHALRPEVGVVGAKLLFPDRTIQHAGVVMGMSGVADHLYRGLPGDSFECHGLVNLTRSISAVTGACLLVRRSTYLWLGGLNEIDLQVSFNDIDFCLRVMQTGLRIIWTPYAELYHHESASRGRDDTPEKLLRAQREADYMRTNWSTIIEYDPAFNPNLSLNCMDYQLAWPPRLPSLV